ncbi:MAG: AAA family ATPase [Blastocatellia bacterium]|nr:AAA family ATPase [Blastocatellia bacterium]
MMSNPFRSSIVADPWNVLEIDVPEIHAEAFEQCRQAVEVVRRERRTTSVLVNGPAGSGKTHLLARLRAHLDRAAGEAAPLEAVFVAVRMQTSARMIWRYLQHRFAADLLHRGQRGPTQLERLFLSRLKEIGAGDDLLYRWLSGGRSGAHSLDELDYEADEVFERIDTHGRISRDLKTALKHLLLGRHRRDAGAWLRGELLPESAASALGIEIAADEDDDLEFRARQVVNALCGLSGAHAPVIFCFDQVEALQAQAGDNTGLFAFGQMVSILHAETTNALLISCIQTAFIDALQQAVRAADLDRMREFRTVALNPLNWGEASRLISARLSSISELAPRRADQSALWPLQEEEIRAVFENNQCVARKLLSTCAELFDRWRMQASPEARGAVSVEEFLDQSLRETLQRSLAENSPAQSDEIFHHAFPMLLGLPSFGSRRLAAQAVPDIDFSVEKNAAPVLLSLCNRSSKSLWRKFDRLRELPAEQVKNLYLLRDERLPISANSVRTLEKREALVARGARWISLSAEMMAALDALRKLLSNAKAGDLARNGDTVPLPTVEQWLSQHLARTLPGLAALVDELAGAASASADEAEIRRLERLTELLQAHHVLSTEDAAGMMAEEFATVAACAQRNPDRFGVLDGPLMILFELTNEMAEA